MRINHNVSALNAWRNLSQTNSLLNKSLERLSSGLRINRAADDAAGLAISEKMRAQIRGLQTAQRNAQDAISLIQTAEGALNETHSILQRMRELAVQAANDTNTLEDRQQIQLEMNQLAAELDRIASTTEFNTQKLLDGSFNGTFQIGANAGQNIAVSIGDMSAQALGVVGVTWSGNAGTTNWNVTDSTNNTGITNLKVGTYTIDVDDSGGVTLKDASDNTIGSGTVEEGASSVTVTINDTSYLVNTSQTTITLAIGDTDGDSAGPQTSAGTATLTVTRGGPSVLSQTDANNAISAIDNAISKVSSERAKLGAVQNRLEHTIANLGVAVENLQAAESRIRDVDMALEMANFTRNQILLQSGTAMLAQANAMPQAVLQLLSA